MWMRLFGDAVLAQIWVPVFRNLPGHHVVSILGEKIRLFFEEHVHLLDTHLG